jgi:hypothetical protein
MDFGGTILAELNRRIRIKIYLCGSTKPRLNDLHSKLVLRCVRLTALRLSHGENRTEVLEENPVSLPTCPLQLPDGLTSNRTWAFWVWYQNPSAWAMAPSFYKWYYTDLYKDSDVQLYNHAVHVLNITKLLLFTEVLAVCSEVRTKHINTQCMQNVKFVFVNI